MNLLYIAEIVGKSGILCVKKLLPGIKRKYGIDFVVANANGATGGNGLGKNHSGYLHKLGCNVLTGGNYIFSKKDLVDSLSSMPFVLRPQNFLPESPGNGYKIFKTPAGNVAVISLLGRSGFSNVHSGNPFLELERILPRIKETSKIVIVDFCGATTAEKRAFSTFADGKVSAVFGSGARVQTADGEIMPGGTASITDGGRTGIVNSVQGLNPVMKLAEFLSGVPRWNCEINDLDNVLQELQGVFVKINDCGKAEHLEPLKISLEMKEE
ncbi:MAG: YmdB family metallophosphoesterase [Spirochaetaceae bacterium]|nr:YmdB family metallophosphoesterase [Spirochaetaceae bacterium]